MTGGTDLAQRVDHIAADFGLGAPTRFEPAARGEQGTVWRLETARGIYAVKESIREVTEDEVAPDFAYQETVLAAGTVSMPKPIRTLNGTVLGSVGEHRVRVYEWVDLLPMDLDLDPMLVGETVAAIHRIVHSRPRPLHWWYTDSVGVDRWHLLERQLADTGAPFAEGLTAELPNLIELEALIEEPVYLQGCHRDLWADNILPTPSGALCVIDWENSGLADPSHELAMPVFDFGYDSMDRVAALVEAYQQAGGPGRLRRRADFSMVIAQFGHFVEAAAEEWLDSSSTDADRAHAIGRFEMHLERRLTIELIDEILESVTS